MKLSPDAWAMLFFTVAAGIILWIGKIVIGWISKAIMAAVLEKVTKDVTDNKNSIEDLKQEVNRIQKTIDGNTERINFLINSLINKNK